MVKYIGWSQPSDFWDIWHWIFFKHPQGFVFFGFEWNIFN